MLIDMELDKTGEDREAGFHWHHLVEQIALLILVAATYKLLAIDDREFDCTALRRDTTGVAFRLAEDQFRTFSVSTQVMIYLTGLRLF